MTHDLKNRNAYLLNASLWMLILAGILLMVHLGHSILTPFILAMLYSILVFRFVDFIEKRTFLNRGLSVTIVIIITLTAIAAILYLLSNQVANYFDNLPEIKRNLQSHANTLQNWISEKFGVSHQEQSSIIEKNAKGSMDKTTNMIFSSKLLGSASGILLNATLFPIYAFLILLYKNRFIKFLYAKFSGGNDDRLTKILMRIKELVKFYLTGLMLDMCFVFVFSLLGFWIVGAPHAIFMALLCALLNLIPYVGILTAGAICALSTVASVDSISAVLGVIAVIWAVQIVENNVVQPKIVGSKVRLNPLATILAVITGGTLAGVSGMFLAIPMLAIINIIIQNVEALVPYSYLISDTAIKNIEEYKERAQQENKASADEAADETL